MQLLSINFDESFHLEIGGERVTVTLLRNNDDPNAYAFGIKAPRALAINREEIYVQKNPMAELNEGD